MGWFYIAYFGGGFVLGFALLGIASFKTRPVAQCLSVAAFVPLLAQCGFWLYVWAAANSCCGHGGQSDSIFPYAWLSVCGLLGASIWSYVIWKRR